MKTIFLFMAINKNFEILLVLVCPYKKRNVCNMKWNNERFEWFDRWMIWNMNLKKDVRFKNQFFPSSKFYSSFLNHIMCEKPSSGYEPVTDGRSKEKDLRKLEENEKNNENNWTHDHIVLLLSLFLLLYNPF